MDDWHQDDILDSFVTFNSILYIDWFIFFDCDT